MSTPSSAKMPPGSSSKIVRGSKRDATGRSRAIGASSVSNSSRRVNGSVAGAAGGTSGHGPGHPTRVFLEGVDVTPQSLLLSRVKPSTPSGGHDNRGKGRGGKGNRSKVSHAHGVGGVSVMGASALFSTASTSSADNDSDNESSTSVVSPTGGHATHSTTTASSGAGRGVHKDVKAGGMPHPTPLGAAPPGSSNQEDEEGDGGAVVGDPEEPVDGKDNNDDLQQEGSSGSGRDRDAGLLSGGKLSAGAAAVAAHARRAPVTVLLAETATEMLLELRSVCVAQDAPNHAAIGARNKRYQMTCAQKKGSDKFVEGRTQTLQLAQKAKEVMTAPPATRDAACVATDWDIYDCAKLEDESNAEPEDLGVGIGLPTPAADAQVPAEASTETQNSDATAEDATGGSGDQATASSGSEAVTTSTSAVVSEFGDVLLKRQVDEIVGATLASPGCMLDVDGDIVEDLRARQHHVSRSHRKGRNHHGTGHSGNAYSQKSRVLDGQRSTANAMLTSGHSGNSNASQALGGDQSSGNVSFGASQDFVGLAGGDGASSGSAATNSQAGIGMSNASHGVLSGGGGVTSGDGRHNNVYARANTNVDIGEIIAHQRTAHVLGSTSLLLTASIVERAVQQNVYHSQHVRYRDFPTLSSVAGDSGTSGAMGVVVPALNTGFSAMGATARSDASGISSGSSKTGLHLEELWAFRCELTQDRTVSCLAWNTANVDLLAVSYARAEPSASLEPAVASGVAAGSPQATGGAGSPGARPGQSTQAAAATAATPASAAAAGGDDGLVLFWSLTNPEFPERIYHLDVGVTSVDFSTAHPYLLAVGFADGVVAIYDTRKDDATPVPSSSASSSTALPAAVTGAAATTSTPPPKRVPVPIATSAGSTGKHLDAVWQVRWVARGGGESVVSVSGDGRVVEWSLKKGLSFSDLMTLKRAPNPLLGGTGMAAIAASSGPGGTGAAGASGGGDGVISRQASGRCLAFASRGDPSVYFVGTEDGLVHKCSVSYNEQYLQTYVGHTGPVYQLLVSPFCSDLFLSCSGDWSLKLWQQADPKGDAALTFRSVDLAQAVLGASWSPSNATVFAAVAEDGRVELWDLAQSILDPVVRHFPKKYVSVPSASAKGTDDSSTANTAADVSSSARDGAAEADVDPLADPHEDAEVDIDASTPAAATATPKPAPATANPVATTSVAVALECTTVAFAPTAPVLVVGDSTGDVTVYRVPAQLSGVGTNGDGIGSADAVGAGVEEQAARLLRAIHPNKHD